LKWSKCGSEEIGRQEKQLASTWKATYAAMQRLVVDLSMPPDLRGGTQSPAQLLLEGQRAWIKYKDSACLFYTAPEFGREGTVLHFGVCKASIIADRVAVLQILLDELGQ
jgi:uncharacterized protein YecT (DUF1311 family)